MQMASSDLLAIAAIASPIIAVATALAGWAHMSGKNQKAQENTQASLDLLRADVMKRIDDSRSETSKRFDEVKADMGERIDGVSKELSRRIGDVSERINEGKKSEARLWERVDEDGRDINYLKGRLNGASKSATV